MIKITPELLDEHREINVYDQWHEFVYSDFIDDMKKKGVVVENILFSGFWSQGDGACFEGYVDDVSKLLDMSEYPEATKFLAVGGQIEFKVTHSGHYYHEMCTDIDLYNDNYYDLRFMETPTEFHQEVVNALDGILQPEIDKMYSDAVDVLRGHMKQLYSKLEKEYEHLTSDDLVEEAIKANDIGE
jgi:hypothetical protein